MSVVSTKAWISAFRLRTLPLALSSILMGSFLAASNGAFKPGVLGLAALTTIFLQVLSNLANDYGDTINGADSVFREGPARAVQSGAISLNAMKAAIFIFVGLSFVSGVSLLYVSIGLNVRLFLLFLSLGIFSIIAAITYTSGKKPYGYIGLGDISVFVFFGLLGVLGTYFLHTNMFHWSNILPAISCGFFSTAVLNVNNIRDIESDALAGKRSVPVRLGREKAVVYHIILICMGWASALFYVLVHFENLYQLVFLLSAPLFVKNIKAVRTLKEAKQLDPFLKQLAISTLLFVLSFGIGTVI